MVLNICNGRDSYRYDKRWTKNMYMYLTMTFLEKKMPWDGKSSTKIKSTYPSSGNSGNVGYSGHIDPSETRREQQP